MRITIEVDKIDDVERLIEWLREGKFIEPERTAISVQTTDYKPMITKGDKRIDPTALFGIWESNPHTLEEIRSNAWRDRR